jgi:hypothetical protein
MTVFLIALQIEMIIISSVQIIFSSIASGSLNGRLTFSAFSKIAMKMLVMDELSNFADAIGRRLSRITKMAVH